MKRTDLLALVTAILYAGNGNISKLRTKEQDTLMMNAEFDAETIIAGAEGTAEVSAPTSQVQPLNT